MTHLDALKRTLQYAKNHRDCYFMDTEDYNAWHTVVLKLERIIHYGDQNASTAPLRTPTA